MLALSESSLPERPSTQIQCRQRPLNHIQRPSGLYDEQHRCVAHPRQCLGTHGDRLFRTIHRQQQCRPASASLDIPSSTCRFHVCKPFERGGITSGLLEKDSVFKGNLVVAFGGGFTGVFGGVHADEGWFHQHLRSSPKIVNLTRTLAADDENKKGRTRVRPQI